MGKDFAKMVLRLNVIFVLLCYQGDVRYED